MNNVRNNGPHLIEPGRADRRRRPGTLAARRELFLTVTFRRRVDNVILRWQGRLDCDQADRLAPWVFAVVLFIVLVLLALAQARSLDRHRRPGGLHPGGVGDPPRLRPGR